MSKSPICWSDSQFPQIPFWQTSVGMCRNQCDSWRPDPPTHKIQRIHCGCPGAKHHKTTPRVFCLCLDVSELLWQHKGNLCNNVNVVADRCMCYPLSVTDGRKQKVTEARNARKSYLILQGSWQDFIKAQSVQYKKKKIEYRWTNNLFIYSINF